MSEFDAFIQKANSELLAANDGSLKDNKIQAAIKYIEDNFDKDLNMAVVSNEISMNYSLFSVAFKNYTGENFVTYVKTLRMDKAKALLEETDLKVNEISKAVGYDNEKHFLKSFKAFVGVSPSEYRKNLLIGD
jgi:YesN/AraC family two-component response regulator